MEPWEDELLWDDDFSDEEEDTDEQIEEADLEMDEDSFADWEDASDGAPENESLEEALAEERTLELESELEQDEHPRNYAAELEDEEEEAAPTSEKRLKREIRAEALKRLEEDVYKRQSRSSTLSALICRFISQRSETIPLRSNARAVTPS